MLQDRIYTFGTPTQNVCCPTNINSVCACAYAINQLINT